MVAASHVAGNHLRPGLKASGAEDRKKGTYKEISPYYMFVPMVFETFGSRGPEATALLADIERKLREKKRRCQICFLFGAANSHLTSKRKCGL